MQKGYSNGPCAPPDCCEQVKPEIHRVVDDLRNVVERYDCLVGRLADKLSCVTISAPPQCSDKAEPGYQTGLANALNEIRCKLRNITDSLESIHERIEL
jgi:hypothetical protein